MTFSILDEIESGQQHSNVGSVNIEPSMIGIDSSVDRLYERLVIVFSISSEIEESACNVWIKES